MTKSLSFPVTHPSRRGRLIAAAALRAAGKSLDRLAWRLAATHRRVVLAEPPTLEFHAEAGAPEGALYADGELVGRLPVSRL